MSDEEFADDGLCVALNNHLDTYLLLATRDGMTHWSKIVDAARLDYYQEVAKCSYERHNLELNLVPLRLHLPAVSSRFDFRRLSADAYVELTQASFKLVWPEESKRSGCTGRETEQRRHRVLQRTLRIVHILSASRYGMKAEDLQRDLDWMTGEPVSVRTVYRDLQSLRELGLVDVADSRWRIVSSGRAAALEQSAEAMAGAT